MVPRHTRYQGINYVQSLRKLSKRQARDEIIYLYR